MYTNSEWETFSEQLLLGLEDAALLFDRSFKIIAINGLFCNITAQSKAALLGKTVANLFPGWVLEETFAIPEPTGQKIYGSGGRQYAITVNKVYSQEQEFIGGILKLTPLEANIVNSCQAELLQYLLNQVPSGVAVFDQEGTILLTNKLLPSYLGLEPTQTLTGRNIVDLIPDINTDKISAGIENALAGNASSLFSAASLENDAPFRVDFIPFVSPAGKVSFALMSWQAMSNLQEKDVFINGSEACFTPDPALTVWITQIEERKRIAGKIHNSLGQLLYGFKMEFGKRGKDLPANTKDFLNQLLEEAIAETKLISFELMPAMLEDFGLEATLEELISKHQNPGLKLSYHVSGLNTRLEPSLEIIVFSVLQELINNVVKHANASKARIYLEMENKLITIKVIDNGEGFEKGKLIYALKSTGLRNIKNSLKLFKGQIKISSQIGKGSLITVQIPLLQIQGNESKKTYPG